MKEMVNTKLNKVEKVISKLVTDIHKLKKNNNHNNSNSVNSKSSKLLNDPLRPTTTSNATATSSHHHHHTIISVDLENLNSHQMQHVHSKAPSDLAENVKIISTPNQHNNYHRRRRIRSASFDPFEIEQHQQLNNKRNNNTRSVTSASRPNSRGTRV